MTPRRTLVLGAGAREHALARRLSRDPDPFEVLVAPGNAGIATEHECFALDLLDPAAVVAATRARSIDLVVVGPEAPLASGVVDALETAGIAAFGPTRAAARLESSKWFTKTVLAACGAPTARAERVDHLEDALVALDRFGPPWVLKADGLAAGKGVCVTESHAEASEFLAACFSRGAFGASGSVVVIEEFLAGEEASVMIVTDGERFVLLPAARDFKRAFDGDRGPNTGGMGARAPHAGIDAALEAEIGATIVAPVLAAMRAQGTPYRGALYAGLMLTREGPKVIEFNARFGDPEAQVVLPLVAGSLGELFADAARGSLDPAAIRRAPGGAVAIVIADARYPERPDGRARIEGIARATRVPGVHVCFAGVEAEGDAWRITGGRAASIVGTGRDVAEAAVRAREAVALLGGPGWRHRSDVAAVAAAGATGVPSPGGSSLMAAGSGTGV